MLTDHVVIDNFLSEPEAYRRIALRQEYSTYTFPQCSFHGIHNRPLDSVIPLMIKAKFKDMLPSLSFIRRSPEGQVEPHFIHTDADMGKWSAILYLNPDPAPGDGTAFWLHNETGTRGEEIPHLRSKEGMTPEGWTRRLLVEAKFNRLLMFPSQYFHSRAIFDNYGRDEGARLTQVTFGEYA